MVSDELAKNVADAWGQSGTDWLKGLPAIVAEVEERWSVRTSQPLQREQPTRVLAKRLDHLAEELGFERRRVIHAVPPRAVLAAWPKGPRELAWPESTAEVWNRPLAYAELLSEL